MTSTPFTYERINKSISNLFTELKENKIELHPIYQRGIAWDTIDRRSYIDSVIKNILPSSLIMNNDNNTGKLICMDGLQRITSLYEFMINNYYIKLDGKRVYYSELPANKITNSKYRIFRTR